MSCRPGSTGVLNAQYAYDAFGNMQVESGTSDTNYLYTGQQYDDVTGLYSLRARFYDPSNGRFMSRDTYTGNYDTELNRYVYGMNNPVTHSDPSGRAALSEFGSISFESAHTAGKLGALAGFSGSTWFYLAARLGVCDGPLKTWAEHTNAFGFIAEATIKGYEQGFSMAVLGAVSPELAGAVVVDGLIRTGAFINKTGLGGAICTAGAMVAATVAPKMIPELVNLYLLMSAEPPPVPYNGETLVMGSDGYPVSYTPPSGGSISPTDSTLATIPPNTGPTVPIVYGPSAPPAGDVPGTCSFSADTEVATPDGPVAISDIELGDEVLAYNEDTGEVGTYPVTALFYHLDPVIVELTIDDDTITTTPEHPFYRDDNVWVGAGDLTVGDEIRNLDGTYGTVTAIEIVQAQQWMYNLTVDEAHTFFVGDEGWLVHNIICPPGGWLDYQVPQPLPQDPTGQIHHIATDKNQWSDLFRSLFDDAGMDLTRDKWNLIRLHGHAGSHYPEYHIYVYDRLTQALGGIPRQTNDYRIALQRTLYYLRIELLTPGSYARKLLKLP